MIKKYFKYILLTFTVMFLFQLDTFAKANLVNMNVSEVKTKICQYEYDGIFINLYEQADGKLGITSFGDLETYDDYSTEYLKGDSYIQQKACPIIYTYLYTMAPAAGVINSEEKKVLYFFFNRSDSFSVINTTVEEIETLSAKEKKITTSCVYKISEGTFIVNYNPITKKIETSANTEADSEKIKSGAKKNWNANESGLICRDDIALDYCPFKAKLTGETIGYVFHARTIAEKMDSTCIKSTSPGGVTVTEKDTEYSGSKLLFLSDICEEDATTMKVVRFIGYLLVIVKILIPIGLIIIGVINFSKAMLSGNDDSIKKNAYSFALKIVFAIVIFILPTVINFIVGLIDGATDGTEDYENCRNCIFDPKNCDIPNE